MNKVIDFIVQNIQTIGLIYLIVGGIVFIAVLLFFWWICRSEKKLKNQDIENNCFYPDEDSDVLLTVCIALFLAIVCALLWPGIPIIMLGICIYTALEDKYGHNTDEEEKE